MKALYERLQANGAIGPMMKVGNDGVTPIYDPAGEQPGQLVPRKLSEYPKAVWRIRTREDGSEEKICLVANSKSEELQIISDTGNLETPRSPLERERDSIAEELATERKMNEKLATQLENALARIEQLAKSVEAVAGGPKAKQADPFAQMKSSAEHKAVNNVK